MGKNKVIFSSKNAYECSCHCPSARLRWELVQVQNHHPCFSISFLLAECLSRHCSCLLPHATTPCPCPPACCCQKKFTVSITAPPPPLLFHAMHHPCAFICRYALIMRKRCPSWLIVVLSKIPRNMLLEMSRRLYIFVLPNVTARHVTDEEKENKREFIKFRRIYICANISSSAAKRGKKPWSRHEPMRYY